jgi:hypothetical protein
MSEPELKDELQAIKELLLVLVERQRIQDWYSPEDFARLVGKAPFTVREWCRLGRLKASKRESGRGAYQGWAISHDEFLRYQKGGLLPFN